MSLVSSDLSPPCEPPMPSWLAQERMMGGSRRIVVYRRMRSGADEGVRAGSPSQKGRLVYSFQWEYHWKTQQETLDEHIRHLVLPCCPCWSVKAFREEQGPAHAMQDAQNCQI